MNSCTCISPIVYILVVFLPCMAELRERATLLIGRLPPLRYHREVKSSDLRILSALGAFFAGRRRSRRLRRRARQRGAKVDDASIKKATFAHWLAVAAKSSQHEPGAAAAGARPAGLRRLRRRPATPKPSQAKKAPTTAQIKTQCKKQYEGLRDQVMQLLINAEWLRGEAADQDIKVSEAEITHSFDQQKQQSFPEAADFQTFLKQSGTTADLL